MAGNAAAYCRGMIKLKSGYGDYSADDLAHTGTDVVTNIPTLPVFSTLKPTTAEISAQVTALTSAMAMYGPSRATAIDAAFNSLAGLLSLVAVNAPQVTGVTDTDLAAIGLPVVKTPTRTTQPPDVCENVRLFNADEPGAVTGKCIPPSGNIRVYEAQWTLDPNSDSWSPTATFPNSRAIKFIGLTRGKDVWVRVRARNSVGAGAWSDPATIMVT